MGITRRNTTPLIALAIALSALAACSGNGPIGWLQDRAARNQDNAAETAGPRAQTEGEDVEAPEVFSVTEEGLWDGRPSLGGVWVAHPDVADPERVIIRNMSNGKSVVGALFRRERDVPGPPLQVSSDAATALDLVAGKPQQLDVVALRRKQVPVDEAETEETEPDPVPEELTRSSHDPVSLQVAESFEQTDNEATD